MGLYRVGVKDGQKALDILAGSTRGEGCPLGMWASFENDIAPNDNWIKEGTTFDATLYPALDLYLGGNTVPERFDHSRPSEIENITLSTSSSNPTIMEYDGFLILDGNSQQTIYVNSLPFTLGVTQPSGVYNCTNSTTIPVKKGDSVYATAVPNVYSRARFYKHPLFIKATSNMSESEATGLLNIISQRESYSTQEHWTGKYWIDGKKIYSVTKHVWHGNTTTQGYTYDSSTDLYSGNFTTNAETIVSIEAKIKDNTGRWAVQKSQGYNSANNILWVSDTSVYHSIYSGTSGWSALDVFITIEYTKTTDA